MSSSGGSSVERRNDTSRKKLTSAQRNLYMKPLLRLKQQEDILEKGLINAIENMKIDSNLLQDIMQEHKELSLKRQNFLNAMYKNINDITTDMDSVKHIVKNPEEIRKLDVNTYKLKLIKLSQKMQDFKKSCPIQSLMEETAVLDEELYEFEPNLQKYEKAQKSATLMSLSCPSKTENRNEKIEYKDVDDFHSLVAVTGHTENWPMEDHLFFLKMRKRCETIPALVVAIQKRCPDLSIETIVNHEAWYKHYEELREKQKAAVKEWRRQKESEKKKNIEEAEIEIEDYCVDEDFPYEIVEEPKINIPKRIKTPVSESRSASSSASSNKSEKKELIKKWRIERENKRSMDEEQIKLQAKLNKEMEENKRKKRRAKIQGALEEYKKKKSMENALKETNELSKDKCKYDSILLKSFRKQDEEFTKKRKDLILRTKRPSKTALVNIKRVELVETQNDSPVLDKYEGDFEDEMLNQGFHRAFERISIC
ncbi:unnamed protein product [Xylocopa violacea]|uniref:Coiled-coil domain-containing protein 112-like n=1 Tax=Xylocopa violacea TaxID=135666 RepID=A0ABP1NDC9_XYLVO